MNDSKSEIKMAALSSALTEMVASFSYENLILRKILEKHGQLSSDEFESSVKSYGRDQWEKHLDAVHRKIRELSAAALARMKGGQLN